MSERDWDKEMAKIDKQLAQLPDDPAAIAPAASGRSASPGPAAGGRAVPGGAAAPPTPRRLSRVMLWARVLVAVALAALALLWPYPAVCGSGLANYLGVVTLVVLAGIWAAMGTWKHRAARLHVLSLAVVLCGLVLGAWEVLPRTGVGIPTAERPATWGCPVGG
ncbi:MAG TPA: hypothetical protein VHQ45_14135 [Gemmatimonadaceae bacterium]|jgi:hypothetical protein|nr:hypothetical protein [Gemmatimonadaceae bacterium]